MFPIKIKSIIKQQKNTEIKEKRHISTEEYQELFNYYYKEVYLNSEDEEMFQRDMMSNNNLI